MADQARRESSGPPSVRVVAVQDDLVTIAVDSGSEGHVPLMKNEVVMVCPAERGHGERPMELMGEVMRVRGRFADVQVFESTAGVAVGDPVRQTGSMLSVELGPGLLGQVFDGLQNPLEEIAGRFGYFLPRGFDFPALDRKHQWAFTPAVRIGSKLGPGDTVGHVQEGRLQHKIMLPFHGSGEVEITWIQEGSFSVDVGVARYRDHEGHERALTLAQRWPVRRALPAQLLRRHRCERLYPNEPMITGLRIVDTFFPVARGGTACIPGPFGAGKTVLQNLISRYADVDLVVVVACGERAGEVVETITEFPKLADPRTGGRLMDRTIIICNTSSMPVAAREASIYTGITLGEYYRQMGHDVLMIADSTSRWAQAMRETSGRMEEIPGEEAYPAYLDSAVRGIYERAGSLRTNDGGVGSLTIIGTVSPAGGNFEEPVTQATLSTVKAFLGLSADRAYKRFYPAVDPLLSWSRYREDLAGWYREHVHAAWNERVRALLDLLRDGDEVLRMMQVTGEEGISLADFVSYLKATFVDAVYLQQDAFDPVDVTTPLRRQLESLARVHDVVSRDYEFDDKDAARQFFTRLTGLFKNLNYAEEESPQFRDYRARIDALLAESQPQSG
ncbi:MAG: V-type ATP synthase subunit A [Nitrococcus mobilis]|nr:V-type ATP synthase subunit A [Nitrococcus mobilis]